jgi:predicted Zn-dependent protease
MYYTFLAFKYKRYRDLEWVLVFADRYALIFVKNTEQNKEVIRKNEITESNVEQRLRPLLQSDKFEDKLAAGDIFMLVGNTDKGMQTYFDVVEKWPESGKVWLVMAKWELSFNLPKSPLLAIMYLNRAIDNGYITADVYTELGNAYYKIGYVQQAETAVMKALKLDSQWTAAQGLLHTISSQSNP